MKTSNPTLNPERFLKVANRAATLQADRTEVMSLGGTINKTFLLLLLVLATSLFTWYQFFSDINVLMYMIVGGVGGLVMAIVTVFKQEWAHITAPIYALLEGLLVGGLSAMLESQFPGIVMQAAGLTFSVLLTMLFAYKSGLIKATENFKKGVIAATGGIFLLYILTFILNMFGMTIAFVHEGGWMGIGFSAFVVVIAALNLVLDFDFIEKAVAQKVPKQMEWYGAFGLVVTLVWLYIEILRLLAKLQSSD